MRFFINPTTGDEVTGWLCPDDYRAEPVVRIVLDGRTTVAMPCRIAYPPLQAWGWHETGHCGFRLDAGTVPGFGEAARLEVYDPASNVLLYRRLRHATPLARKLLLVGTGATEESAWPTALHSHFQASHLAVGNLPDETLSTILLNAKEAASLLVSGRICLPRYEDACAHGGIETAILIRDPYEVLALRLEGLRRERPLLDDPAQRWRVAERAEAIAFAAAFDPCERRASRRALRDMSEGAYRILANPLTRQLGRREPGGTVDAGHVTNAIDVLARVTLVGHGAHPEAFRLTLLDHLGLDVAVPDPPRPAAPALAESLASGGDAEFLVAHDLRLSETVRGLVARQWSELERGA